MSEAAVEQRDARVELDIEEVKRLVVVSQSASIIDMYGAQTDDLAVSDIRVFINGRLTMMWLSHVITSAGFVTTVVMSSTGTPMDVIVIDGSEWRPRPIVYSTTDDTIELRHLL